MCFSFVSCRYFSDTGDPSRNPNEHASISPIPPQNVPIVEVDTTNNNKNAELLPPRIHSPCFNAAAHEHVICHHPNVRRCCHDASTTPLPIDTQLNEWLIKQNIDKTSRDIILNEQFSFTDFVHHMEKTDLHRIGLKYASICVVEF